MSCTSLRLIMLKQLQGHSLGKLAGFPAQHSNHSTVTGVWHNGYPRLNHQPIQLPVTHPGLTKRSEYVPAYPLAHHQWH